MSIRPNCSRCRRALPAIRGMVERHAERGGLSLDAMAAYACLAHAADRSGRLPEDQAASVVQAGIPGCLSRTLRSIAGELSPAELS